MNQVWLKRLFAIGMAMVMSMVMSFGVFALGNGAYLADTLTFYLNPDTGVTDDGGTKNSEIGEGMCRGAVHTKALIEVENGKTWVTMRMKLYSNISNIRFYTQNKAGGDYTQATFKVMAENSKDDSADLRFAVPSAGCYVRTKMYVAPMGRDVTFYWKADGSSAVAGNGDFIKTIKTAATSGGFADISDHWAKGAIEQVVKRQLFSGTSDTKFSPDAAMTRGMFVTVLGRLSGDTVNNYNSEKFKDVKQNEYYAKYIGWASAKGIVAGTTATTFAPDASISCEQMASIMVRYAKYKGTTLKTNGKVAYKASSVSKWAKSDVEKATKAGLLTKNNTNNYHFQSAATRADVASLIMNYINKK